MFEQPRDIGPFLRSPVLGGREDGTPELPGRATVVDGGDHVGARVGQRAGAVDDLLQDCVGMEARADVYGGLAQFGDAPLQHRDPLPQPS